MVPDLIARAAAELGRMGFRVAIGSTIVSGPGKLEFRPAHRFANGAAPDTAEEAAHLVRRLPGCNRIAIVTGPCRAGFVVGLDLDRNHGDGADGISEFRRALDEVGMDKLPPGPRWRTPRGGFQQLFLGDPTLRLASRPVPGIEVKWHPNLLLTCPPTRRPDGDYTWLSLPMPPSAFPPRLVELWRQPDRLLSPEHITLPTLPRGAHDVRSDHWVQRAVDEECQRLGACGRGSRRDALLAAARKLGNIAAGQPDLLSRDFALKALRSSCIQNGFIEDDGLSAFTRTFLDGFDYGLKWPRQPTNEGRPGHATGAEMVPNDRRVAKRADIRQRDQDARRS